MLAALRRDLGLTPEQARARHTAALSAAGTQARLRSRMGAGFGGAWMSEDGLELVVGVTDPTRSGEVRQAGARPVVVARSAATLEAVQRRLEGAGAVPKQIYGWYVDQPANTVMVEVAPGAEATAAAFLTRAEGNRAAVRITTPAQPLLPAIDYRNVRGGEAMYFQTAAGQARCSVGFSVVGGYVTAGHCSRQVVGDTVQGYDQQAQGQIVGVAFPNTDYEWIQTNSLWVPQGVVYNWGPSVQGVTPVDGSLEAPVNADVCRSGSTTGWHCGQILATNQMVNYPQGAVFGLTQTSACAGFGDSGGPFLAGGQAQGVLSGIAIASGASDNCGAANPQSFFQPVNPILARYGLALITTAPLGLHDLECHIVQTGRIPQFSCTVTYNGGSPPYTHTWSLNSAAPFQAGATISAACRNSSGYSVSVTIGDSLGHTLTANTGIGCP
jgi:streptogrisin C